ncbi:hypothetical protein UFOVP250_35 [uncultured Caudovirales phage]|uniref:Uncharacterized protein n=1 Tax=uncultured Caudovirales phage TaxID=2100421 RepID=A0A6J5LHQ2_9CAUD|nr:hypothetical protein UFOVP250_35 [uncultured Caudovirales phage]
MKRSILLTALLAISLNASADVKPFVTLEVDHEGVHSGNDNNSLNVIPGIKLDNITVDVKGQVSRQDETKNISTAFEPRIKYDLPVGYGLTAWARVGLGEKLNSGDAFGYYTIEPGVTYQYSKEVTLSISDKYRDSFATGKDYQTNTVYAGGSYTLGATDTIAAKLYRKYNDTESTGVEVAYTHWF